MSPRKLAPALRKSSIMLSRFFVTIMNLLQPPGLLQRLLHLKEPCLGVAGLAQRAESRVRGGVRRGLIAERRRGCKKHQHNDGRVAHGHLIAQP